MEVDLNQFSSMFDNFDKKHRKQEILLEISNSIESILSPETEKVSSGIFDSSSNVSGIMLQVMMDLIWI